MEWRLTDEEIDAAVDAWLSRAPSWAANRLERGHWEDAAPTIAEAQARKLVKWFEGHVEGMADFTVSLAPPSPSIIFMVTCDAWEQLRKEVGL